MADLGQQLYYACDREDPAEAARLLDAGANKEWRDPARRSSTLLSMDALPQSSCLLTAEQTRALETAEA